jgi:hypothetical protein
MTTPDEDSVTLGEVGRAVVRIEQDLREVKGDVKAMPGQFVLRSEYDARNESVDAGLGDIKQALERRSAALPTWLAAIAAGAAALAAYLRH